jgi:hypothetical protein
VIQAENGNTVRQPLPKFLVGSNKRIINVLRIAVGSCVVQLLQGFAVAVSEASAEIIEANVLYHSLSWRP